MPFIHVRRYMRRASMSGKKCVIYCRTSTDKQETGLDTQYFDCRTQVSRIGLELLVPTMEETTVEGDYDLLATIHTGGYDFARNRGLVLKLNRRIHNVSIGSVDQHDIAR